MAGRWAIGGAVLVAVTVGGLGTFLILEVGATDRDIETAVERLRLIRQLLEGDILDGASDLSMYGAAIAHGDRVVASLRADHPLGNLLRDREIDSIEAGYKAVRQTYEIHN